MNKCYSTSNFPEQEKKWRTYNFLLELDKPELKLKTDNFFHKSNPDLTWSREVIVTDGNYFSLTILKIKVNEKI